MSALARWATLRRVPTAEGWRESASTSPRRVVSTIRRPFCVARSATVGCTADQLAWAWP